MKFDFFKKKNDGGGKKGDDLFDPTQDGLDFDELEESGEFLSDENFSPPLDPGDQPPAPVRQPPPPVQQRAPLPPAPTQGSSKLPLVSPVSRPAAPPLPPRAAPPVFDDLTVINQPALKPNAPPVTAPPPVPARPVVSAPEPPAAAPPRADDDDVTMILSAPVGEESVVAWLVVASEPGRGFDYRLPGGMARIGIDAGCEICLDFDSYISGRHAEVSFRNGHYHLRDLNSTNGCFVNEIRTTEATLNDNDRVRFGQTTMIFNSLSL